MCVCVSVCVLRDAEPFFSSPGDFTAAILFLLFLGKIARNGYVLCLGFYYREIYAPLEDNYMCCYSLLFSVFSILAKNLVCLCF